MLKQRLGFPSCCWMLAVLVCLTEGRTKSYLNLHHHMTERELQKFFGVSSHEEVPEYDIAQSFSVDEQDSPRPKRISESKSYKLKAFGSSLHLNLEHDPDVKSPNLVVRSYEEDGSVTDSNVDDIRLYTGHVVGHPASKVAVKENNGLSGLIDLSDEAFFVQPLTQRLAKASGYSGGGQPHLIYRKSMSSDKTTRHLVYNDNLTQRTDAQFKVLEMTLVADQFVFNVYREETVEHLLMIAHVTRSLYLDRTIGSIKINLVIVGIVLKKDGLGYDHTASSLDRLGKLNAWAQQNLSKLDSDPHHPDTVFLISKYIAGQASSRTTCYSTFGIACAGDVGPATGVIVAHEIAHTFGVAHDGPGTQCPDLKHIMSSVVASGADAYRWSKCSQDQIQAFLRSPISSCLNDEPKTLVEDKHINKLPGQETDRDTQCKMMYDKEYFACPHDKNNCGVLMCANPRSGLYCSHRNSPPVDGTACGPRHWCIAGKCEDNGSPIIDGMWSGWSSTYSPCSRTCGGGIKRKTRTCTNPRPQNGGERCPGSAEGRWELCNTQDCPKGSMDYRIKQCKAINPKYDGTHYYNEPCILGCKIGGYVWNKGIVKDGTRCSGDPIDKSVCIKGRCRIASCDGSLDTGIKLDRCRVCDGDSSSCGKVSGLFDAPCKGHGLDYECVVVNIPVGARTVHVEKKFADPNSYLGVKDGNGRFITDHFPTLSFTLDKQGTRVHYYEGPKDRVFIPGPTTIPLSIVSVPIYFKANKGVEYSMLLTNMTTEVVPSDAEWKISDWSPCTKTCAGGTQVRAVECVRKDDGSYLGGYVCESAVSMPAVLQACNTQACPQSWYKSDWSPCSKTCGKGFQTREIVCRQKISKNKYENLPDASCSGEKPTGDLRKECNKVGCPVEWVPMPWSKCSTTCGNGGVMTRDVLCKRRSSEGEMIPLHQVMCKDAPRPQTVKTCEKLPSCPAVIPVTTPPSPSIYHPLGCYKDGKPHAISKLVINLRDFIDWNNLKKTIDACAQYVHKNYPQNKVFGIQFYGECWTGAGAENTYMKYGAAENCFKGVGSKHSFFVYEFRS